MRGVEHDQVGCSSIHEYLTTGDEELDKVLGGGIRRGTLIVILGHPGAGKTTFLAKVTHANMTTKRLRTLYVSMAESRIKFHAFTKMLGLDFERFEKEGLFKFLEVPSVTSELIDILTSSLVAEVSKFKPDILVIDSITPVLKVFGKHPEMREFLHSGIYKLTNILGVSVFLIADLPYGAEAVDLGGIEFVADGVIVLKTEIKNGLITRWMEVRKMRGAPITIAEIPFTIVKGQGIKAFVTPLLSEIPLYRVDETVSFGCKILDERVGRVPRGAQITIIYPPGMNTPKTILAWLAKFITINKLKTMVISYIQPGKSVAYHIKKSAKELGVYQEELDRLLSDLYDFNPAAFSLPELVSRERSVILEKKPALLIMHGLREVMDIQGLKEVNRYQFSCASIYRKYGIIAVRLIRADYPREYVPAVEFSDVVIDAKPIGAEEPSKPKLSFRYIFWRTFKGTPYIIDEEDLIKCLKS
ncbi:MAG: hypothetical protein DRO14_05070 [Thermoprotei archaeon]|nr:MAG: hypothetical protein DRO14_05070 [Thermoprotei archaeon]